MKQLRVCLVVLGHSSTLFDDQKLKNWKSAIFKISVVHRVESLPASKVRDEYLDQKYSPDELEGLVSCPSDCDLCIGVIAYRFIDNFYLHRVGEKSAIVSIFGISDILAKSNISMENFIVKQIYEMSAVKLVFKDLSTKEVYSFIHLDTRGCLFDMNGDKQDIIHNTERPIICDECKGNLKKKQIEETSLRKFENELKTIRKPQLLRIELFIKRYPLLSVIASGLFAIALNLISSGIWDFLIRLLEESKKLGT